jgi:ribose transport system substrate-binding protein
MSALRSRLARAGAMVVLVLGGCGRDTADEPGKANGAACPDAFAAATAAVARTEDTTAVWTGPTSGPRAAAGRNIAYVGQTMTNPGVAGAAKGAEEAATAIGWNMRVIDGSGTPEGIQAAFSEAIELGSDGIILGGFGPDAAPQQVAQANAAGIPLVGWHAIDSPGPGSGLFTNVTTRVDEIAKMSAQWIIKQSGGEANVVVFTDESIPFAHNKSELIKAELATCAGITVLSTEDIPLEDSNKLTPDQVSSLLSRFGDSWTYSVAINDLYFADAADSLRAAGKPGDGAPFNIGAGDGEPAAFERIRSGQYQAATVPEPLLEQGWQIIDEFNRAFAGDAPSGYVAPIHLTTITNVDQARLWEPNNGYRQQYKSIWGE